ncbi:acetamidase/formamidase family protein [Pseudonocardia nigra]|uniref:acetamidase/formamidase family protein n=1 Tax=Pseudonocardia nigra TaxID=1921578 RepID=UPI001C5FF30A|nr:acetamidase/formamidase family protein [Pseudonocardia nigra]
MATHEIRLDTAKPLATQPDRGHNRRHPDIAPVLRVRPGDEVVIDTLDAADAQLTPDAGVAQLGGVNLNRVHPLTGPIAVDGAEPGDALVVELLECAPAAWGYTVQIPGFGFLRDEFPEPFLVRWRFTGGRAVSEELPGVAIPAAPFLGTVGVAPSADLLTEITRREEALLAAGGMVLPPEPGDALPSDPAVARHGLRTMPPRENAGNIDIPQAGVGTRLVLPVLLPGASFSAGDGHFAQGEGEACGTAIEMAGTWRLRFDLRKGGAAASGQRRLRLERDAAGPPPAEAGAFVATTGISVDTAGTNHGEDITVAARDALREMIELLVRERGFGRQQAYALCSVAVQLRISALPDVPNMSVTALLPLGIFDAT